MYTANSANMFHDRILALKIKMAVLNDNNAINYK